MATISLDDDQELQRKLTEAVGKLAVSFKKPLQAAQLAEMYREQIDEVEKFMCDEIRDHDLFKVKQASGGLVKLKKFLGPEKVGAGQYSILDEAFTDEKRRGLLAFFAASLHPFACAFDTNKNEGDELEQTMAGHAIRMRTEHFKNSLYLACERVWFDWDEIESLFYDGDEESDAFTILKLSRIGMTGSDYHKRGKSVFILEFKLVRDEDVEFPAPPGPPPEEGPEPQPQEADVARVVEDAENALDEAEYVYKKLIYKPSDVEIDCRLVGDTKVLLERLDYLVDLPALNEGSLFELLNEEEAGLDLPTYRILPRNPGSRMQANAAGSLPVYESYGFIEYLTFLPDPPDPAREPAGVAEQWDWLAVRIDEVRQWYRALGWYMVLGRLLGFRDVHQENLRSFKRQPCLIDLECSFGSRTKSVHGTGIMAMLSNGRLGANQAVIYLRRNDLCHSGAVPTFDRSAQDIVVKGAEEAIGFLRSEGGAAVVQQWLADDHLARSIARVVPVRTQEWSEQLYNKVYGTNCTAEPPAGDDPPEGGVYDVGYFLKEDGGLRDPFAGILNEEAKKWLKEEEGTYLPTFALASPKHDWQCFLHCDVPAYYHRLNSLDLLDARGHVVKVDPSRLNGAAAELNKGPFDAGNDPFFHYDRLNDTGIHETPIERARNLLTELRGHYAHLGQHADVAFSRLQILADIKEHFGGAGIETTTFFNEGSGALPLCSDNDALAMVRQDVREKDAAYKEAQRIKQAAKTEGEKARAETELNTARQQRDQAHRRKAEVKKVVKARREREVRQANAALRQARATGDEAEVSAAKKKLQWAKQNLNHAKHERNRPADKG